MIELEYVCKNLNEHLFPEQNKTKMEEENIKQMISTIHANQLLQLQQASINGGIVNVFTGQKATAEQASDTLNHH